MMFFILMTAIAFAQNTSSAIKNEMRLNKNGVALCAQRDSVQDSDCFDPVSYVKDQKAQKVGSENSKKYRTQFEGATYVFSNQNNLDLFKKNPQQYLPEFGGWCAYAVATSKEKVDIDPTSFSVQDGKLLLFYNGFFSDTRKFWTTDTKKSPQQYLQDANTNWPVTKTKEP